MPTLTAYQVQFRRRLKRAIRLRATVDRKARARTQQLADAIAAGAVAAKVINESNRVYNVDLSTQTILMHSLAENAGQQALLDKLSESTPSEETLLPVMCPMATAVRSCPPAFCSTDTRNFLFISHQHINGNQPAHRRRGPQRGRAQTLLNL